MGAVTLIDTNPNSTPPLKIPFVARCLVEDTELTKGQQFPAILPPIENLVGRRSSDCHKEAVAQERGMSHGPGVDWAVSSHLRFDAFLQVGPQS